MYNSIKKEIYGVILDSNGVDSYRLLNKMRRKAYTKEFDNTIMRFVRRLAENGYLKRTARGIYKTTARGRRFFTKNS